MPSSKQYQADYSSLLANNPHYFPSWENFCNTSSSYPEIILDFCKQSSPLPYDFYKIVASYFLIPSALAKRVPYLFFYGVSGSGKSTFGKLASKIHGVVPTSSTTTYAAIRNDLRSKKTKWISIPSNNPSHPDFTKEVEANTFMVWEDIDALTFRKNPNVYAMFKFGYDKATDTIQMSSAETKGQNETFRCFCPKIFSSVHPIHAIEDYNELKRRLIVIPTKKIEEIDDPLLDIDNIDWTNFSDKFNEFWNLDQAEIWLTVRQSISRLKGLTSHEKAISLDLIATGISACLWQDEIEAVNDLKECFNWLKQDIKTEASSLEKLITELVKDAEKNAKEALTIACISNHQLRVLVQAWYEKGWLMERPVNKEVAMVLRKLGYKNNSKGQWINQK